MATGGDKRRRLRNASSGFVSLIAGIPALKRSRRQYLSLRLVRRFERCPQGKRRPSWRLAPQRSHGAATVVFILLTVAC